MARISSILGALLFAAASLAVAAGQATRPVFPRPLQGQTNAQQPPVNPQQQRPVNPQQQSPATNTTAPAVQNSPATPPTAPLKPPGSADPAATTTPTTPMTPPVVTYREGLLTVQATNSTLGAVLNAIRNKTGIEFEGLEGAAEHVALSAGPAPAADVLSSILQGSKFSFVAIGRADDPTIVQRVILTAKGQGGAAVAGAAPQPQARPSSGNGEGNGEDEDNPDEQVNVEPQDTAAQPPQMQQPQPQEQPQQQNQQPKTPEQLFQELQQMKQQQMQQEGAPQPNPGQVPRKPPQ